MWKGVMKVMFQVKMTQKKLAKNRNIFVNATASSLKQWRLCAYYWVKNWNQRLELIAEQADQLVVFSLDQDILSTVAKGFYGFSGSKW